MPKEARTLTFQHHIPPSSLTSWDDEEEVSNNNTNDQSLAAAVWCFLNPSDEEPPILTAMDHMRVNPLDHHKQGLLAAAA